MSEISLILSKYDNLRKFVELNPEFNDKLKLAYKIFFKSNDETIVKSGQLAQSSSYKVGEVNIVENINAPLRLAGYGIHACFVSENCNRFYSVDDANTIKYQIVVIGEYAVDDIKLCCRRIFIIPDTNNLDLYNKQMYNFIKKYIKNGNVFVKNIRTGCKFEGTFFDLHEQIGNANENSESIRISIIRKYYKKLPNGECSALATFEKLSNDNELYIHMSNIFESNQSIE